MSNKSAENEPKLMWLSVTDTMCGLHISTVLETTDALLDTAKPDLYRSREGWLGDMADTLNDQVNDVRCGDRDPSEVGIEDEARAVLVYPDGRIIDACDLTTDYRVIFDKQDK